MKIPLFKPSAAKTAPPLASLTDSACMLQSSILTDVCETARSTEISPEMAARYRQFCQQQQLTESVENLLSFAMHKHVIKRTDGGKQKKIFARLATVLPQPFSLQEVLHSQRPLELREQLARAQRGLAQASIDMARMQSEAQHAKEANEEISSHLNERLREREQMVQFQARQLDSMQTSLSQQQAVFSEQRDVFDKQRIAIELREQALRQELQEAHHELDAMSERLRVQHETTKAFVYQQFHYGEPPVPPSPRRRHQSDARSRPASIAHLFSLPPPLPES